MIRLQLLTGMRLGEVCPVCLCDMDRTGEVWAYRPASHKTQHHGKARTVFVGTEAQAVLGPYLENRRMHATVARVTPGSCGNTVGNNRKKQPARLAGDWCSTTSYRRCVQRASEKAVPLPPDLAAKFAFINTLPKPERAEVQGSGEAAPRAGPLEPQPVPPHPGDAAAGEVRHRTAPHRPKPQRHRHQRYLRRTRPRPPRSG